MMNQNVRSALLGGLAATFVVAAAFAPKLMSNSHPSDVRFHQTAADSDLTSTTSLDTTTSTVPETTVTTAAPTTTTTVAPTTTTTTAPVEAMPPTVRYFGGTLTAAGYELRFWAKNPFFAQYANPVLRFTVNGAEVALAIPPVNDTPNLTYLVEAATAPVEPLITGITWDTGGFVTEDGSHPHG